MAQHLMVAVDSSGGSVVYVAFYILWDFLRLVPSGTAVISYHYQTSQAQVSLPGLLRPVARQIVDAALMEDGDLPDRIGICDCAWAVGAARPVGGAGRAAR
jgi:hypothetical protein